jgi:hypothetical protein
VGAAENHAIARRWLEAFNAHDLDGLLALYAEGARHTSPKIRALHPQTGGELVGKGALRGWWEDSLRRLPTLRYEAFAITADEARAVMEYQRHLAGEPPMPVSETLEIEQGRIVRSRVYHG